MLCCAAPSSDLHMALRHAYLGPKLDLEDAHQLPECFEADERSNPEVQASLGSCWPGAAALQCQTAGV